MTRMKSSMFVMTALLVLVASAWWMPAVEALTCVAGGGAWNDNSTWTGCSDNGNNGVPTEHDYVEIEGAGVEVTIPSGFSAEGYIVRVDDRASLIIAGGSLRTASLNVQQAAMVSSTGTLNLTNINGQPTSLYCVDSTMTFAHGVSLSNDNYGSQATFQNCEASIDGSLELTSAFSGCYMALQQLANVTVNGDVVLNGGVIALIDKRGVPSSSLGLSISGASLQVGGDLRITSASTPENATEVAGSRDATIQLSAGLLSVGGSVEVRSGDAVIGNTGNAYLVTDGDVLGAMYYGSYQGAMVLFESGQSVVVVGGSLTVESGSVTGLRHDGNNNGYAAGDAMINMIRTALLVNGSDESGITVRGGHSGNSTTNGGSFNLNGPYAGTTQFIMGLDSVVAVGKDVLVQSGNGGDANVTAGNDDGWNGGNAKPAFFRLAGGVDAVIGGNLIVLGGHGGNTNDKYGIAGSGGMATGYLGLGGSLTVGGDVLIASGSAGTGQVGGSAYHAGFYVGTSLAALSQSGGPPPPILIPKVNAGDEKPIRGSIGPGGPPISVPGTGKLDMRVGGSVTIAGGVAGSSNYSNYQGGQCNDAIQVISYPTSGGFIVENAWEGNVVIGGDVIIESCMPGGSVGGSGQNGDTNMLLVVYGGSVSVGGSVSITSANGSSVTGGSNNAGNGGSSLAWVLGHATLDIAGSLTLTNGNGGDVVDGTGSPGNGFSDGYSPMLLVLSNAHMTVGGDIALTGGNGGKVDAAMTPGSSANGGAPLGVTAAVMDVSSLTVGGNMALVCGAFGNSSTNSSINESVLTRNQQPEQPKERQIPLPEHTASLLRDRRAAKRGGYFNNDETVVEVYSSSKLHVAGDLTLGHHARQVNNLNLPAGGFQSSLLVGGAASVTIEGDVAITGGAGGILSSNASFILNGGGMALIEVQLVSTLRLGGNVALQGGDAAQNANGFTGIQGVASVYLEGGEIHQSGRFSLVDGQGQRVNETGKETVGIYLWQSEWTVYPCPGAGLQTAEGRNGSFFLVEAQSSFRDCRSASARQGDEAQPLVDVTSCSPCSCSEAPFNTCPEFSSASRDAQSAVMACVQALLTHLHLLFSAC